MGDVLVIDTDRSFTGQDGHMITPDSELYGVPGELAGRLFSLDDGIDYIFVLQNIVTVRRRGGWDEETAAEVTDITHSFLRFYPDDEAASPDGETENEAAEEENGAEEDDAPVDEEEAAEEENGADEEESPDGEAANGADEGESVEEADSADEEGSAGEEE